MWPGHPQLQNSSPFEHLELCRGAQTLDHDFVTPLLLHVGTSGFGCFLVWEHAAAGVFFVLQACIGDSSE